MARPNVRGRRDSERGLGKLGDWGGSGRSYESLARSLS